MFWHHFKYNFLISIRNKSQIMWSVVFVVVLGTMFKLTFGDIYNQDEKMKNMKVAVCIEDEQVEANFKAYLENISIVESGDKLLDVQYLDRTEGEKLLEDGEVEGLFYSEGSELKLLITKEDIKQSILASVVTQYHQMITILSTVQHDNPEKLQEVMTTFAAGVGENEEINNSKSDMEVYAQYFYNLIAMACLMCTSVSMLLTTKNQANTSVVGARKEVSGASYFVGNLASLLAAALVQILCVLISFGYLLLIGTNFGGEIYKIVIVIFAGVFTGMSIGFCIGSFGSISEKVKDGISTAVAVGGSFLSGLMIADIHMLIENNCPIINRINPVALVADAFYSINTFETNDRLIRDLVSLAIISAVFILIGNIFGRRKQYASL